MNFIKILSFIIIYKISFKILCSLLKFNEIESFREENFLQKIIYIIFAAQVSGFAFSFIRILENVW
jgi:hypothetical protein